jgi:GNAT superfamily N-acetyltransferase
MVIRVQDVAIRRLVAEDVQLMADWAAKEGWNPGLYDAGSYFTADPNGFLVGLVENQPVATLSAVRYDDAFGFLGFFIVAPEFRGRGYGLRIWEAGLEYLRDCTVGLDGVVDQQENYKKSGFRLAYRNIRFQGRGGGDPFENPAILDLGSLPVENLLDYEKDFFPADRFAFIKCWISQPGSYAFGFVKDKTLAGYGVIRRCQDGYKIGPLHADDPSIAESLFLKLRSKVGDQENLYLDVPEPNQAAMSLTEKYGMKAMFETARMYKGQAPILPTERIFGVTSFEIG